MFFKTVVASIIAALLAGGVVYFGMPAEPAGAGSVALRTSSQTASQAQTSPQPETSQATKQNREKTSQPEERWIDKYVTGPLRRTIRPEPKPKTSATEPQERRKWEQSEDQQPQTLIQAQPQTQAQEKQESAPAKTARPEPSTQKAKPASNEPRYYVLEKGELREIEALPLPTLADAVNPDASFKILTVSNQAKQIDQPDLRDRAYLDIVDYALLESLFTAGISAMEEIKQVELRDTARSRIAVAYARAGDSRAAFAIIDDVEVDELRDVLRLQVIEAIILPEALPDGL